MSQHVFQNYEGADSGFQGIRVDSYRNRELILSSTAYELLSNLKDRDGWAPSYRSMDISQPIQKDAIDEMEEFRLIEQGRLVNLRSGSSRASKNVFLTDPYHFADAHGLPREAVPEEFPESLSLPEGLNPELSILYCLDQEEASSLSDLYGIEGIEVERINRALTELTENGNVLLGIEVVLENLDYELYADYESISLQVLADNGGEAKSKKEIRRRLSNSSGNPVGYEKLRQAVKDLKIKGFVEVETVKRDDCTSKKVKLNPGVWPSRFKLSYDAPSYDISPPPGHDQPEYSIHTEEKTVKTDAQQLIDAAWNDIQK